MICFTKLAHSRVTLSRMNAIDASLLSIQSEMDNLAKVIARLAATLEGFERQLQQSYERRQAALEHYRLEYEGPTCKTE